MVVQLRSRGKVGGSSAEPEATRKPRKRTGRQQSERPSALRPSIEVQISASGSNSSRQSTIHAIPQDQPSTSRSRVTRSKRANTPHEKLPSPTPRKRRATNASSKDQPAKRQHRSRRKAALENAEEDEQPQLNQEHEEASEAEENALPEHPDFMNIINSNILGINSSRNELPINGELHPERAGRRISEAEVPQIADSDENIALDDIPQEQELGNAGNNQASTTSPEQPEAPHEELPVSEQDAPQATQVMSQFDTSSRRQSLRRKRRRQSQKPTYDAPGYNARGVSPDLGSAVPQAPATEASASQQVHAGGDIYNVPSDGEQPSQPIVLRGEKETHGTHAEHRRKTKQGKRQRSQTEQQNDQAPSQAEKEQEEGRNEESARKKDKNGDQDGEYADEGQDSDNDEPAAEQELDTSDLVEDSLLLDEPPSGLQTAHLIPTAWIKRDTVQKLVWTTTYSGWMNGRKWKKDALELAKTASEALKEDERVRSRLILAKLYDLYELCKEIPSSSISQQLEYIREHTAQLNSLYTTLRVTIDEFISSINTIMEQGDAKQVSKGYQYVTKLHRRIIPMLVLVLDQSFQAGCGRPGESAKKLGFQKGEFTVYTLEPLERAAGWALRLSQVVESWYELHPPRRERDQGEEAKEHRGIFREATKQLKKSLEKARESIGAIKRAPNQRRKVMQKDEAVRMEREADAQRRRNIQDMQMQRFLQSMQKIESSQPRPPTIGSYRQAVRSYQSATSRSRLIRSQEPSDVEYFEKHGWHYWEDDHLLSLIRTTSHPNYEIFGRVLPDRDPDELKERSNYLRMVMRDKYERKGIQPPGWCVAED
ncbi:hypothetical protein NOF04DRAFT_1407478 [Fusarium oxysporum II5]|uniref:Uncharacterized protein n=2 Tax=Fusarium oxysporum species complex TaxID=171631 RepID=X0L2W3_FUSO5|nr:uncharacterized protein FOIG_06111 [Fusarium odoratissimum NRRL 54006]EXM03250.1 hypothetical protein FOIG_06111 [Fusarium odoratissimum NRRL 54006]KAK2134784.1 hypothetical protein NOF04DRAFT_1407478 [Fusarium oxysporum II5]TXC12085.1 hypothetical protein FocTR4_00007352 [Fusarium oxysporum f. sp. cubense]